MPSLQVVVGEAGSLAFANTPGQPAAMYQVTYPQLMVQGVLDSWVVEPRNLMGASSVTICAHELCDPGNTPPPLVLTLPQRLRLYAGAYPSGLYVVIRGDGSGAAFALDFSSLVAADSCPGNWVPSLSFSRRDWQASWGPAVNTSGAAVPQQAAQIVSFEQQHCTVCQTVCLCVPSTPHALL
jgi:hypothetical protein